MLHGWFTTQTCRRPEAVSARPQAILLAGLFVRPPRCRNGAMGRRWVRDGVLLTNENPARPWLRFAASS